MNTRRVLFVRIADMKYYRGITNSDKAYNGGSFVKETGYANECFNFLPILENDKQICIGYTMLIGNFGRNCPSIHIENIRGCKSYKNANYVDGVTVVFCSRSKEKNSMSVCGFYKNARVWRYPERMEFDDKGNIFQDFNFEANVEDCVLLPKEERLYNDEWEVPAGKLGRSSIWFAADDTEYADKVLSSINNYNGINWITKEV